MDDCYQNIRESDWDGFNFTLEEDLNALAGRRINGDDRRAAKRNLATAKLKAIFEGEYAPVAFYTRPKTGRIVVVVGLYDERRGRTERRTIKSTARFRGEFDWQKFEVIAKERRNARQAQAKTERAAEERARKAHAIKQICEAKLADCAGASAGGGPGGPAMIYVPISDAAHADKVIAALRAGGIIS